MASALRPGPLNGDATLVRVEAASGLAEGGDAAQLCALALMKLPDPVLVTDATDHIRWANEAAAEMTGWSPAELSGMPLGRLLASDELDHIARTRGVGDPHGLQRYHCTLLTRAGSRREVSVSVGRSRPPQGLVRIYVLRGLCRQREVESRLLQQLADKHELEAFRRQASCILHDLRHMSNVLGLTVKNFLRQADDPAVRQEALRTLDEIAAQTGHLLNRLAGPLSQPRLHRRPTALGALVRRALDLLAGSGYRAEVAATVVHGLDPALVFDVDPGEMLRVFFNVVLNAYEAVGQAGQVTIRSEVEADGQHLRLVVEDTGPGLLRSYLEHDLFQPFRSTKAGGLGLGLYQTKVIVEAHGGTLQAFNRDDGPGARVTIRLPATPAPRAAGASQEDHVPA